MDSQSYKIVFGDEIRRISFPTAPTWAEFQDSLAKILGSRLSIVSAKIQYQDEEGDFINISSELEWNEASIVLASNKIKRIIVTRNAVIPNPASSSVQKSVLRRRIARQEKKETVPEKNVVPERKEEVVIEKKEQIPEKIENVVEEVQVVPAQEQLLRLPAEVENDIIDFDTISCEIKGHLNSVIDEIQKAMPFLLEEGAHVKTDVEETFKKILAEGNSLGSLLIRDGSQTVQTAYNSIMTQINIVLPFIINGGLPMIKSFAQTVLLNLKTTSESARSTLRSIDIFDKLDISEILNKLALLLLRHQKVGEAMSVLEVLVDRYPTNIMGLYNLACAYSISGKKNEAIGALDRAVQAGFKNVNAMETDPDLSGIRDTEEYLAILAILREEQSEEQSESENENENEKQMNKELEDFQIIDIDEEEEAKAKANELNSSSTFSALPKIAPSIYIRQEEVAPVKEEEEKKKEESAAASTSELVAYENELRMLNDMGFNENHVNLRLLIAEKGDLAAVISHLLL